MSTVPPAEGTEAARSAPRLWYGTVTIGTYRSREGLFGPWRYQDYDGDHEYYWSLADGSNVSPAEVTDLRPAAVVPERADGDAVERVAEELRSLYGGYAEQHTTVTDEGWRADARYVLAAQHPPLDGTATR